ncbi:hypothetical protein [Dysgonomonas sp. GY617]|uniref:hypothetical protein n=1 Tax=Dysgonomonas sp. GY617 TaxID=2780420 RepID=UPI001883415F|nr:hypothetical protein [Dysgonomonas sp. GY617]MBF0577390.1 hypothetical protein [Dysgonomonas sp. GY617]
MAKPKNVSEEPKGGTTAETVQNQSQTATAERPLKVDKILKKYSTYQSLYIDSHGGAYTTDTPQQLRGSAILYENPYFKP